MLSYLWGFMIIFGIIVGVFNGNIADVSNAAINSSKEAVTLCISMLGIMAMWTGMMQVAKVRVSCVIYQNFKTCYSYFVS